MKQEPKKNHLLDLPSAFGGRFADDRHRDPFELLADDSFFEPLTKQDVRPATEDREQAFLKAAPTPRKRVDSIADSKAVPKRESFPTATIFLGGVILCLVTLIGVGVWQFWPAPEPVTAFAYWEIRAIGPEGRPVAGAVVKQGETVLGHTDSFGEWRRYMRVRLGTTLPLSVFKKHGAGNLYATKNVAIPAFLPKTGELELKAQIGLQRDGDTLAQQGDRGAPVISPVAQVQTQAQPPVKEQELPAPGAPGTSVDLGASPKVLPSIWVEERPAAGVDPAKLQQVLQQLRDLFAQGGYKVEPEAPLVVQVGTVKDTTGQVALYYVRGLVRTRVKTPKGQQENTKNLFSMLRSFQEDPKKVAADITLGARRYGLTMNPTVQGLCLDGIPCSLYNAPIALNPPFPDWQRKQLKVSTKEGTQDLELFVSGFMAKSLGNQIYEFWGPPSGPVNVTVVQGTRTIFREKLVPPPVQGAPLMIAGSERSKPRPPAKL